MRLATKLGAIQLDDWNGERRALRSFWSEQPVVLVFIRHFG